MKSFLILLFSLALANFVSAQPAESIKYDIYVDGNLSADAVGTYSVENRDNSGNKIGYKTIQGAVNAVTAGQTIGIRAGTYNPTSTIAFTNKSGTDPNHTILLRNYGSDPVVINGSSMTGYGISISNSDYIHLKYFTVQNFTSYGISFSNGSTYGLVNNMIIHDNGNAGVYAVNCNYITISNCVLYSNNYRAIYFRGSSYCTADKNEIYDNYGGISTRWRDSGSYDLCLHNTISNNLIYNNNRGDAEGADGISINTGSRYNKVLNNICFGNYDDGIDCAIGGGSATGDIVDGYPKGTNLWATLTGNICFDNGDGAGAGDGNGLKVSTNSGGGHLLGYNIAFDNDRAGFDQDKSNGYPSNYFYNNIAYKNDGYSATSNYGFVIDHPTCPDGEGAVLFNNIALDNPDGDIYNNGTYGVENSNNNFWGDGSKFTGFDGDSLSGDPKFANKTLTINTTFGSDWTIDQKLEYIRGQVEVKFSLEDTSPAKNAGRIIDGFHNPVAGDEGGEDIIWYGSKPDMGASITLAGNIRSIDIIPAPTVPTTSGTSSSIDNIPTPAETETSGTASGTSNSIDITPTPTEAGTSGASLSTSNSSGAVPTESETNSTAIASSTLLPSRSSKSNRLGNTTSTMTGFMTQNITSKKTFDKYEHLYSLAKRGWTIKKEYFE